MKTFRETRPWFAYAGDFRRRRRSGELITFYKFDVLRAVVSEEPFVSILNVQQRKWRQQAPLKRLIYPKTRCHM